MVAPELGDAYSRLLREAGIDFIELGEQELCCGSPVSSAGYKKDTKELAEKNKKLFEEHGITRIIANCPGCTRMLKSYGEIMDWNIEVRHVTEVLLEAIKKGKLSRKLVEKVTYHDPCHLGRHLGKYDEPREIMKKLGCELIEMDETKKGSFCCGGGGGLKSNFPDIASKMADERVRQAKLTGAKKMVTTCPLCFLHMKDRGIDVVELSGLIEGTNK